MANPSGPPTAFDSLTVAGVPTMGMGPGIPTTTGNTFFVNSVTGSNGNTGAANSPYATIAAAYAKCIANNGDTVVCEAGHAEPISAAAGLALNIAGVTVVGLGEGASRPTLTFGTSTAATVTITAASNQLLNFVGVCNIDQLVSAFVVSAADCNLQIEWHDGASNKEAVRAVLTTAAADRFTCNLTYIGFTAGTHCVNAIRLVGCDTGNITIDFYGKASTAVVEFLTTACTNVNVGGYFYVSGTTDLSKNVVDTVTGSTWSVQGFDGAAGLSFDGGSGKAVGGTDVTAVLANMNVPTADSTANTLERDVVGNKADAALTAIASTKSVLAYVKTALQNVGFLTDAAVYVAGTTNTLMAYLKGVADMQERVAVSATAVLANGTVIFTVAGGPIQVQSLISECVVGGDAQAATVQYSATATGLAAQTISGASASTANAAAHATVALIGTALATAALYNANGTNLGMTSQGGITINVGTITTVIGSGPTTTGTWRHILRYKPLTTGVTVS